jgi:hypothetical protein
LSKVKVRFGKPFYAKNIITPEMDSEAQYQTVTQHLKREIQNMLGEMRR